MSEPTTLTATAEKIQDFVNSFVNKTAKVAVFGAGNGGAMMQKKFRINGFEVNYFVDNSPQKQGTNFNGVPVISVEQLKEICAKENIGIFIATVYAEEIFKQLEKEGLAQFVINLTAFDSSVLTGDFWQILLKGDPQFKRFLSDEVRPNSILLIELNPCHGVVMPGYAKYLTDLGYNVDILMSQEEPALGCFCMLDKEQYRQYAVPYELVAEIINEEIKFNDYKILFWTSHVFYQWKINQMRLWTVREMFPNIPLHKSVFVSHHKEYNDAELLYCNRLIMLADFLEGAMVCPHWFGNVRITPKSSEKDKVTKFITVGGIVAERRNINLIFEAAEKLAKFGAKFKITVIGRVSCAEQTQQTLQIPDMLKDYIEFKGELPYPEMYQELEDADFFLNLLDPENPQHYRYITEGTSGSFLMIYGFRKVPVLASRFAKKHHLTDKNAVLYDTNADLALAMYRAIAMSSGEYAELQSGLATVADDIYKRSLENLRALLSDTRHREQNVIVPNQKTGENNNSVCEQEFDKCGRTCIVHIGYPKTGTSSIQEFLFANRNILEQKDIFFAGIDSIADGIHLGAYFSDGKDELLWGHPDYHGRYRRMLSQFSKYGTTILSSEVFPNCTISQINSFREQIKHLFGNIKILVYLRRQPEWNVSLYSQAVKQGNLNPHNNSKEVFDKFRPPHLDYYQTISRWASVFGRENIIVRVFDKKEFFHNDLLEDFCSAAALPFSEMTYPSEKYNVSADSDTTECLRLLRRSTGKEHWRQDFRIGAIYRSFLRIQSQLGKAGDKGYLLSRSEAQEFIDRYRESNNAVAREYLGREQLFDEDVSMYPEETEPHHLTLDKAVEIFGKIYEATVDDLQRGSAVTVLSHSIPRQNYRPDDIPVLNMKNAWSWREELQYMQDNPPAADGRIKIGFLDSYIARGCNVKCRNCLHFSPYRTGIEPKEEVIFAYEQWSKRLLPELLMIHGGEPLLHPDFTEIVLAARRCFPDTLLCVITNGLLLPKLSDESLKLLNDAGRVVFRLSTVTSSSETLLAQQEERLRSFGIQTVCHKNYTWWIKPYCTDANNFPHFSESNPQKSHSLCLGKYAIYGSKLYYCCICANAVNAVSEGALTADWLPVLKHRPMTLANTQAEIWEYLHGGARPECAMCLEKWERTESRQLTADEVQQNVRS